MNSLKEKLEAIKVAAAELENECRVFCADETKSVAERWEVFKEAPNKIKKSYYELPPKSLLGFEIESYDDLYLERYQTFDVIEQLNFYQNQLGKNSYSFTNKLDQEKLDLLKNYYMVRYIGSWKNDW